MDALADILQPYKEIVGSIAAFVTIGQMFSGSFICWDIYKQGSTRGIGIMPFLGGVVMTILNLQYGYILRDDTMIQVNMFGLALNIVYVLIYFNYTQQKVKVWAQIGLAGAVSAALIGYAQTEDPKLVETRFGTIITAFMFYLIASPLFGLKEIIQNKSTEGMPFPIILSGTVVTFMWLLYGIILRNKFLVVQNVVALVLCASQLSLFVIYPSKPKGKDKSKVKAKKTE
ncbi:sugar transporter SWEET1 [Bombyx mori]|uniref:Sugar transporter SWEET n=1 Tax=Bombyx mori TaxID=7091 RepID=A0A8R2DMV2_BOMMO|nr:sugar transporter SWEET1 [Bombyx mori]XP_021207359.1 sugar transporter SWEET1 [Bombyx mori]